MNPRARGYELLTVKKVCELLQVHHSKVYKLIKAGKIPAFKIGSDWRFRRDLIMRWMAENTKGTPR
jgi:excisionase family DNA binding protein